MVLPQRHRLRGRRVFDRLYRQGRRFNGALLVLRLMPEVPELLPQQRPAGRSRATGSAAAPQMFQARHGSTAERGPRALRVADAPLSCSPADSHQAGPRRSGRGPAVTLSARFSGSGSAPAAAAGQGRDAESTWRCAVVVSGKVSRLAVRRNRLRRLLHTHLLARSPSPTTPQWLMLSLRPGAADADEALLLGECDQLLRRAGLLP